MTTYRASVRMKNLTSPNGSRDTLVLETEHGCIVSTERGFGATSWMGRDFDCVLLRTLCDLELGGCGLDGKFDWPLASFKACGTPCPRLVGTRKSPFLKDATPSPSGATPGNKAKGAKKLSVSNLPDSYSRSLPEVSGP